MPSGGDDGSPQDELKVFSKEDVDDAEKHAAERNLLEEKDAIVCVADHEDKTASTSTAPSAAVCSAPVCAPPSNSRNGDRRLPNGPISGAPKLDTFKPTGFFDHSNYVASAQAAAMASMTNPFMLMTPGYHPYATPSLYAFGNRLPFMGAPHPPLPLSYWPGFGAPPGCSSDASPQPPPAHIGVHPVGLLESKTGIRSPFAYPFATPPQFPSFYSDYLTNMAAASAWQTGLFSAAGSPASSFRMGPAGLSSFLAAPSPAALSPLQSPGGTQIGTASTSSAIMPPPRHTPDVSSSLQMPHSVRSTGSTATNSSGPSTPLPSSGHTGSSSSSNGSHHHGNKNGAGGVTNGFHRASAFASTANPLASLAAVKPPASAANLPRIAAGSPPGGMGPGGFHSSAAFSRFLNGMAGGIGFGAGVDVMIGGDERGHHQHRKGLGKQNGHHANHSAKRAERSPKRESESPKDSKEHIKKPLNAFMLYMKEQRPQVMAEIGLQERQSAEINRILGRKWHSLPREDQQKYYEMARTERQVHMEKYPGWSARDNYAIHKKRKKRRDKIQGNDSNNELKKCRARFGLSQQDRWCKHCRRKKKCLAFREGYLMDDSTNSPPAQVSSTTHYLGPSSVDGSSASGSGEDGPGSAFGMGPGGSRFVPGHHHHKRYKLDSVDSSGDARSPYSQVTSTTHYLPPSGGPRSVGDNPLSVGSSFGPASSSAAAAPMGTDDELLSEDLSDPSNVSEEEEELLDMTSMTTSMVAKQPRQKINNRHHHDDRRFHAAKIDNLRRHSNGPETEKEGEVDQEALQQLESHVQARLNGSDDYERQNGGGGLIFRPIGGLSLPGGGGFVVPPDVNLAFGALLTQQNIKCE